MSISFNNLYLVNNKKYRLLFLLLVVLIGGILRLHKLGDIPAGFHRDEAYLGYNAYSILKTGRDMSGNLLPLYLRSFLNSPSGYSYLCIPSIMFFGLTPFAIRLPSALFGTFIIITVYFLAIELLNFESKFHKHRHQIALFAALFTAISPWSINLSRVATENIVVLFFLIVGLILYIKSIQNNSVITNIIAYLLWFITLFIYQGPRAFLPMIVPLVILILNRNSHRKLIFRSIIFYLLFILIPALFLTFGSDSNLRLKTVSIFSSTGTQLIIDENIREDGVSGINSLVTRIFHNKILGYSTVFFENYFSHFSYKFLLTDSGYPYRYKISQSGLIYGFEAILIIIGLIKIITNKLRKTDLLLLSWIIIAPIGSALTHDDVPNLQRTVIILPALSILAAIGLKAITLIEGNKIKFIILCALSILTIFQFSFYLHQYFVHQNIHQTWYRNEGYNELVKSINDLLPNYEKAIITDRESAPAIFFLFFGKYDPKLYQNEIKDSKTSDLDTIDFARYDFSKEECPFKTIIDPKTGNTIISGKSDILYVNFGICETPVEGKEIKEIKRGDNSTIFKVVTLQ